MKFLTTVLVLASSTSFAEVNATRIRCYETSSRKGKLEMVFKDHKTLRLVYPTGELERQSEVRDTGECLEVGLYCDDVVGECDEQILYNVCRPAQTSSNGLVRLGGGTASDDVTYCDPKILDYF